MLRRPLLAALLLSAALPTLAAETGAQPNVVRLRGVMVPVIVNGQVARYASYEIGLEIAVPARVPEIQLKQPRLQDAVTGVMYEAVDKGWVANGAITNPTAVRARIEEACNALLGPGTVSRVLITPALPKQS